MSVRQLGPRMFCAKLARFWKGHAWSSTRHTSHCTLRTPHFALTLETPHFISSNLIKALPTSPQLFSYHLISSNMSFNFFSAMPESACERLHCDLQEKIPKDPVTAHKRTTARCKTPCRNQSDLETTVAASASHTSCLSSPAAAILREKTQRFAIQHPLPKVTTSLSHHFQSHHCSTSALP